MKNIILVGVSGVGKTTLGKELELANLGTYVSSGEAKIKLAEELNIRKGLSQFTQSESILLNAYYFERLNRYRNIYPKTIFVDTHATYPLSDGSFVHLLPQWADINKIVLLTVSADVVKSRREKRGRSKDSLSIRLIQYELEEEYAHTFSYANRLSIPLLVLPNTSTGIADEVNRVKQFLAT